MKKMKNSTRIEGYIYEHSLQLKESGPNSKHPGTKFISGELKIATNEELTNIVPVHFTYVTATTAKGNANATYSTLMNIINGKSGSVMGNGVENAKKVYINSAIGLNEFYSDRNGVEELVSAKRNEGGFITEESALSADESTHNTFEVDMIITKVIIREANPERNLPEKAILRGYIFDFKNALLPVEFSVVNPNAISYFIGLEPSETHPVFTSLKGKQIQETVMREVVEEGAFGTSIKEVPSNHKDWVITWAAKEPYAWDIEDTILISEFKEAMANREITIAGIKQRQDEYKASRAAANTATTSAFSDFNF